MNGIAINIDPVAFHIGSFELRWYSVAVLAAIIVAVLIGTREAKKKEIPSDEILALAIWAIIGGIVGARLFHVIDHFGYYAGNPSQILHFQGLAIWGALAGGGIAAVVYSRVRHLPLGRLADALVPALLVGQIVGRFGCIVNGDAYGGPTCLPWGFIYTNPNAFLPANLMGVPTHPYPVYEILWNGAVLLALLKLRPYFERDGALFMAYLSLYSLGRFGLTFVREERIWFWGLQEAQVIALVIFAASAIAFWNLLRHAATPSSGQLAIQGEKL